MSDHRCRVVNIEWDRGHERFDAIVRAESDAGIVVTEIHDIAPLPGLSWIRRNEVIEIDDLADDAGEVRLADIRGELVETVEVALTAVEALLVHLAATEPLIGLYRERTGSDELLVGKSSRRRRARSRSSTSTRTAGTTRTEHSTTRCARSSASTGVPPTSLRSGSCSQPADALHASWPWCTPG
jgi:hypothetical protein